LAEAAGKADLAMKGFEATGILPKVTILDSDEELAELVLRELCVIALGLSGDKRTKIGAANLILAYTKPKPLQRQSITADGPEDWLRPVIAAGSAGGNDA
jgi:hypothetical protein